MLQKHSILRTLLGKYFVLSALATAALLLVGNATWADDDGKGKGNKGNEAGDDRAVRLLFTIPVPVSPTNPNKLYSFDISWVDQTTQTYYLADRSNNVVDVVDAKNGTFVRQITASPPFKGFVSTAACTALNGGKAGGNCSGPNGVVAAFPWLFVTDGGSRVVNFDLSKNPPKQVSDVVVASNDPNRTDELAYDPRAGLLLVINPNEPTPPGPPATTPFGTWIKVNKATGVLTVGGRLTLDAAHGVDAQNGAEQPVWEPHTGRFYLSVPQVGPVASIGGVARIVPNATGPVEAVFPVDHCGPAGLTVGPRQDLFVGCNTVFDTAGNLWDPLGSVPAANKDVIIDAKTGKKDPSVLDANVFGVGAGDEVWFNKGDGNYYATGSGSPFRPIDVVPSPPLPALTAQGSTPLGVVDAKDQKILQQVTTFNVPAVGTTNDATHHPAGTAHSVAANAANNHIFVPLAANVAFPDCVNGCIAVFGHTDED
jgi:hypothetical protein